MEYKGSEWINNTLFGLVIFGAIFSIVFLVLVDVGILNVSIWWGLLPLVVASLSGIIMTGIDLIRG